jgi:poly-gamma-glutamate capsule biosynthesis protein CapA/YwtB (metallophosphatase superfamily)
MKGRHRRPGLVGFAAGFRGALAHRAQRERRTVQGARGERRERAPLPGCQIPGHGAAQTGKALDPRDGDVSLDPSYLPAFRTQGYGWAWSGLSVLFQRDDLTVINLECPATEVNDPEPKQFVFRCDPAALPVARRSAVEVANQANNHAYDQGPNGLLDSTRQIRRAGIAPVGAGADDERALGAATFDLRGWRVAVVGIDEVLDPTYMMAGQDGPGTAAGHDFGLSLRAVRQAAARADIVVVMIHWGVELDTQPRAYQVEKAHRMIDAGADVIFGGHSHRLQPLDTCPGRPIF